MPTITVTEVIQTPSGERVIEMGGATFDNLDDAHEWTATLPGSADRTFRFNAPPMQRLANVQDLQIFAALYGLRQDWHEPDEQGVSARFFGEHFDNAGGIGAHEGGEYAEMHIVLTVNGIDTAYVNLATLLSWAARRDTVLAG